MVAILIGILAGFIIGVASGIIFVPVIAPVIGQLVIDTNSDKDILRFEFDIPPEDIIGNRTNQFVLMRIVK